MGGGEDSGRAVPGGDRFQGHGIDALEVVHRGKSRGDQRRAPLGTGDFDVGAVLDAPRGFHEGRVKGGGYGALLGGKIGVARRYGEPVGGPRRGDALDPHPQVQIDGHAADDDQLLVVFLAEKGGVGGRLGEQLDDHGGDPVEMARPGGTAQDIGKTRDRNSGGEPVGVDLVRRGCVEKVHPRRAGECGIGGLVPGIGGEILIGAELRGVDEEADDHPVVCLSRGRHERPMALVQGTHGRHQGDGLPGLAPVGHPRAQGRHAADRGECELSARTGHGQWGITRRSVWARVWNRSSVRPPGNCARAPLRRRRAPLPRCRCRYRRSA